MKRVHVNSQQVEVGDLVSVKVTIKKRQHGSQMSLHGVVYYRNPNSGYCKVATPYGVIRKGAHGKIPETFSPSQDLHVWQSDTSVSPILIAKKAMILQGKFDETKENFLSQLQVGKHQEETMRATATEAQSQRKKKRRRR